MLLAVLQGCSSSLDLAASPAPDRPVPAAARATRLHGAHFEVPGSVRPGAEPAPELLRPLAPFEADDSYKKADIWRIPLPVGQDLLPTAAKGTHTFGSSAPPGLVVEGPSGVLPFEFRGRRPRSYGFDKHWLYVGVPLGDPPPNAADYTIEFPKATAAERAMNLATSGLAPEDFVPRTVTVAGTSHDGWFLPAPALATVEVDVPEHGLLAFAPGIVPPALASADESDGASVVVTVVDAGAETEVDRREIRSGWHPERFDLTRWGGRRVTLRIAIEPGPSPTLDYVLLEDPVVYAPVEHPRKVVLLFVDTLRADHLGFLGYPEPTSPAFDRWAATAAVFPNARSVAPWTLPSARSALTGRQPEQWEVAETLPQRFADAGWRTDAIVANAFLSQPFGLQRGWSRFRYDHLAPPDEVAEYGLDRLADWPDRDQVLLVHVMGPHLPYDEPWYYRYPWAGTKPAGLPGLGRPGLLKVDPDEPTFDAVRAYVTARYDANVAWTDAELSSVLDAAGPDATAVLFSDHGEELWEHGGFEHGHAFWDELLRVPLAVKSPHLVPGRYAAPVSLLDLAPTVLELEGLGPSAVVPGAGSSLVGLTFGDPFPERPVGFGRPLYGEDGWGVVDGAKKWVARGTAQTLHDLASDPGERQDLATDPAVEGWGDRLSAALGRPVHAVWRITLPDTPWPHPRTLAVSHPGGIAGVWTAFDPRGRTAGVTAEVVDGVASVVLPPESAVPSAIYVLPAGDPLDPRGLVASLVGRQVRVVGTGPDRRLSFVASGGPFVVANDPRNRFEIDLAVVPARVGAESASAHPEMDQQLRELGYLDP